MLETLVEPDADLQSWRREKQRLEDEVRSLRRELEDAHNDRDRQARSIENLRLILSPLHRGLRALFGEIELAVGEADTPASSGVARTASPSDLDPRWQSYKNRFPGAAAQVIDALLIHGDMQQTPLSKLVGIHYETLRKAVAKLRDAGAVSVVGGVVSLKR